MKNFIKNTIRKIDRAVVRSTKHMPMENLIRHTISKSRTPARLDYWQSTTGLVLGLFMWAHMFLVASVIFGRDAFNCVAKMMEGAFLSSDGEGFPFLVVTAACAVFTIFVIHAALAVRKFPASWQQYRILRQQMAMMDHEDTNLWFYQFITGFIMFFLGSAHLVIIMTHPVIGPYISADRIISDFMLPFYFVLVIAVELHGTIGIYRLCMKWNWFTGKDPRAGRKKLKKLKKILSFFFITVGLISLLAFTKIGIEHRADAGKRYVPVQTQAE